MIEARVERLLPPPDDSDDIAAPYLNKKGKPTHHRLQVSQNLLSCTKTKKQINLLKAFELGLSCDGRRGQLFLELWQKNNNLSFACEPSGDSEAAVVLRALLGELSIPEQELNLPQVFSQSFYQILAKLRARQQALGEEELGLLPGSPVYLPDAQRLTKILQRVNPKHGYPLSMIPLPPKLALGITISATLLAFVVGLMAAGVWGALFLIVMVGGLFFGLLGAGYVRVEEANIIVTSLFGAMKKKIIAKDAKQFYTRQVEEIDTNREGKTVFRVFMTTDYQKYEAIVDSTVEKAVDIELYLDHVFNLQDSPVDGEIWRPRVVGYKGQQGYPSLSTSNDIPGDAQTMRALINECEPAFDRGSLAAGRVRWNEDGFSAVDEGTVLRQPYEALRFQLSRTALTYTPSLFKRLLGVKKKSRSGLLIEVRETKLQLFVPFDEKYLAGLNKKAIEKATEVDSEAALELLHASQVSGAKILM